MAISKKIINFLEKNKIKYEAIEHKTVYTGFDKAATTRMPEKAIGKTLVLKTDKTVVLILIPANKFLDKKALQKTLKAKKLDFAKEDWMKKNLKGIKVGATPPFQGLWKLPLLGDKNFLKNSEIILSAGDYEHSIKINSTEFKKSNPEIILENFSKAKK